MTENIDEPSGLAFNDDQDDSDFTIVQHSALIQKWLPRRTLDYPVIDRKREEMNLDDSDSDRESLSDQTSHRNETSFGPDLQLDNEEIQEESIETILEYPYLDEFNNVFYFQCMSKPKRNRTTFTTVQLIYLEKIFRSNQYLIGVERKLLAKYLDLTETQIKVWFQNRRTKDRKKKID